MDDLIRRSDVMPAVEAALELYPSEYDAISEKVDAIPIPVIDPESLRARGKWEKLIGEYIFPVWRCSHCKLAHYLNPPHANYCPYCGARMKSDDGQRAPGD